MDRANFGVLEFTKKGGNWPQPMGLLHVDFDQINLDYTLTSGQAFRWRKSLDGWWTGVIGESATSIRQVESGLEYKTFPEADAADIIRAYFRLEDDISRIYSHLAAADSHVSSLIQRFAGLRLLRQKPEETLLSFVCSAANSIPRISRAIEALSNEYGHHIGMLEGQDYHAFPEVRVLASAEASELEKTGGLGFRGSSIKTVAEQISHKHDGWLSSLRSASYEEAKAELLTLRGVGQKIADCVCLFALDKDEAVPVDTHIRQLASRLYLPGITAKSVTAATYDRISGYFRETFGEYAGWAQQFLYYEDVLRSRGQHAIGD